MAQSRLPISFEENQGQFNSQTRFVGRGQNFRLVLAGRSVGFAPASARAVVIHLVDARPKALNGAGGLPGRTSYFIGPDPAQWRTNISSYAGVHYQDLYDGIDLLFYGRQDGHLEYDFVVAPGKDPSRIALHIPDAALSLRERDVVITLSDGSELRMAQPVAFQETLQGRATIAAHYQLSRQGSGTTIRFALGQYDHSLPLVIHPVLSYGTYLGGNGDDQVNAVAVDGTGAVYLTGVTKSTNFPGASGSGSLGSCHLDQVPQCNEDRLLSMSAM